MASNPGNVRELTIPGTHGTCNAWGMVPSMRGICERQRTDEILNAYGV